MIHTDSVKAWAAESETFRCIIMKQREEIERLRKGIKGAITDIIEDDAKSQNILGKLKALLDEQVAQ